jgi:hypothetical protein
MIRDTIQNYLRAIAALNAKLKIDEDDYPRIQSAINNPHQVLSVLLHQKYVNRLEKTLPVDWEWYNYFKLFQ